MAVQHSVAKLPHLPTLIVMRGSMDHKCTILNIFSSKDAFSYPAKKLHI